MGKLFGTDGVRGEAGSFLTAELAMKLGQAAGRVFLQGHKGNTKVVIGRDTRISGQMLENALTAGLTSVGVEVVSVGVVPTPAVAYLVREYQAMAGAVISASHNPFQDNGIKFFSATGHKLSDEQEAAIEAYLEEDAAVQGKTYDQIGYLTIDEEGATLYKNFVRSLARWENSGLHAVVDCANGSSSYIAQELFESLGMKVTALANQPDGVNINVACGSTHPEHLQEMVLSVGADVGLAFDGDADRFLAVDENGTVIDGDHLMAIYAHALKAEGKLSNNQLVATVMSNLGLRLAMEAEGIEIVETKVGDRYVNEALLSNNANLGGEQSGHIIFRDHNSTGDGLISAMMLLNIMVTEQKSLSELAQIMTSLPQVLINVPVRNKNGWQELASVSDAIAQANESLDGTGRVLVRASGTENLLRVMVEGADQGEIEKIAENIADAIRAEIGV